VDGSFQQDRYYGHVFGSLRYSTSAIFQGTVYIFGSDYYGGQTIQKVNGCEVEQLFSVLSRPVDHNTSIVSTSDGVYTCFRDFDYKWCQLFDGSTTRLIDYGTRHDHEFGCMAVLNGNPTAIGGDDGTYVETLRSSGWTEIARHIINPRIGGCTTIDNDMVTIGGDEDYKGVYIYSGSSGRWSKLGNLKGNHIFNSVIQLNGVIYSTTYPWNNYYPTSTTANYWQTTESPENLYLYGIERIELSGTEITSKMISHHPTNNQLFRPVLFPSDGYQCSTPPSTHTTTSYPIYSRAQEE